MKHNDLFQKTQDRDENAISMEDLSKLEGSSYTDMYSYIVFDTTSLSERHKKDTVTISRLSSTWEFTSLDEGVGEIFIKPSHAKILLDKKHKDPLITCVAVERYIYAGKDARETITTPRMGTINRGTHRVLYQLFISTDQFLYGEWWHKEGLKNTTIKLDNLVFLGQQLIDLESGDYV